MKKEIIYISYDGLMESIGISQIYKYLINLQGDYRINIISYEKKIDYQNKKKINHFEQKLKISNLRWTRLKYHKYPMILSTVYDTIKGFIVASFLIIKFKNIKLIHIRGYLPGLIIFPLLYLTKIKILFDMRGFWPDEKADRTNLSRNSLIYKFLKFVERILLQKSEKIICLTYESIDLLLNKYHYLNKSKFLVIPTCVDTNEFKLLNKNKKNKNKIIFAYLGSVDTAYNINVILNFFKNILKFLPHSELRIFTKQTDEFRNIDDGYNFLSDNLIIKNVEHQNVSEELSKCDIGIFYLIDNFSIKASFPTKIGEFLSCGLPIICNNFNKDILGIISSNKLGYIYDFDKLNYEKVSKEIIQLVDDSNINFKCSNFAKTNISLKIGVKLLKEVYDGI